MKRRNFIATLSAAATALALPFRAKAAPRYIAAVDPSTNPIWTNDLPDWHGISIYRWDHAMPSTLGARAEQASPARASLAGTTLEA